MRQPIIIQDSKSSMDYEYRIILEIAILLKWFRSVGYKTLCSWQDRSLLIEQKYRLINEKTVRFPGKLTCHFIICAK